MQNQKMGGGKMEFNKMEEELQEYLKSEEFQNDCLAIKAYYTVFEEELPIDLEIEQTAVCEKRIYFENIKRCMDEGHDWQEYEEELFGKTEKYSCCKRCGKTQTEG